jgi:ABC-type transport system involved in multi-copper enzyme maturation permease subunit
LRTIFLIAGDSIRALLHQRLLVGLMLASIALTIAFSVLMNSTRTHINDSFMDERIEKDSRASGGEKMTNLEKRKLREQMDSASSMFQAGFYGVASFAGTLVALFIFSTAVSSEIRRGTIRLTLSKPVSRMQFLLGKYIGGLAVMATYALVAGGAIFVFGMNQDVELNPAIKWSPWLMFCEQLMIGSLAMLLSLFIHPVIACVLALFSGNGFYETWNPLYYMLPSYADFGVFFDVLQGTLVDWKDVLFLSLYAFDFVTIMLLLAIWRFRTKEVV